MMSLSRCIAILAALLFAIALVTPALLLAQSDELREAIRAELLKDARAEGISDAQLNLLVEALAEDAAAQGLRAEDISPQFAEAERASALAVSNGVLSAIIFVLLALMCAVAVWLGLHRRPTLRV
jgi:preprotein translocase subunit SecG